MIIRLTRIKKLNNTQQWQRYLESLSYTIGRNTNCAVSLEDKLTVHLKMINVHTFSFNFKYFIFAFHSINYIVKKPKWLLVAVWLNKWYSHTVGCHIAIKKEKGALLHKLISKTHYWVKIKKKVAEQCLWYAAYIAVNKLCMCWCKYTCICTY